MTRIDPKRIKHARIHLRDHRPDNNTSTAHTSWPEPCPECEEARELLKQEQPLTRAEFYR